MFRGDEVCCFVFIGVTWNNSSPASPTPIQIVRALEHLHSKLSVIHRGQCLPPALRLREGQTEIIPGGAWATFAFGSAVLNGKN